MDCKYAEKTSLLIDGELSVEEAKHVKAHVADCSECREMETDFLYFRRQIKESASEAVLETLKDVRLISSDKKETAVWKKWISLPAPALVALLLLLAGFGAWAVFSVFDRSKKMTVAEETIVKTPLEKENRQTAPNGISLSRFDRGGRAEIYTTRRPPLTEGKKFGSNQ